MYQSQNAVSFSEKIVVKFKFCRMVLFCLFLCDIICCLSADS
jgi:hypothetical protein